MSEEAIAMSATLRACIREGDEYEAISRIGLRAADLLERQAAQLAALRAGASTEDLHAAPAGQDDGDKRVPLTVVCQGASIADGIAEDHVERLARIIYDACFLPGTEDGDYVMPPWEEALRDGLGGSDRAMVAARAIARQFRDTGSEAAEIRRQALEEVMEALGRLPQKTDLVFGKKCALVRMDLASYAIRALADKPAEGGEA